MRDGSVFLAVGDVCGHGIGPALLMASTCTLLRALAETHTDLSTILTIANRILIRETREERFVTLLLGHLNPGNRSFLHANAGHPPGYFLNSSGKVKAKLERTSMPLGVSACTEFLLGEPLVLCSGDLILFVTDGILEAESNTGDFFGWRRTLDTVRANLSRSAQEIVDALGCAVREFSHAPQPADDQTVLVVKAETDG
jgi:sigma-B regulation protein RsbU (phosphoserine phosphatase)